MEVTMNMIIYFQMMFQVRHGVVVIRHVLVL